MKAYIFDLDGTLLDSMGLWEQIDVDFLSKRGFKVPDDYINAISSRNFKEAAEYTIERFNLSQNAEELMDEWNNMALYAYSNTIKLKPHAKDYLTALKSRGAKLGIATNLPSKLHTPALFNNGIDSLFDAVCSSDEVLCGKNRPDIFLLAARKLGVPASECIVFEDILPAIKSAKSVGMTVYGVYDESSSCHLEQIKQVSDGVIYDFCDAPLPD